jgi:hypothetical protein
MTARNLTFVSIKCGKVIDDLSYYKIVKTPQSPHLQQQQQKQGIQQLDSSTFKNKYPWL